MGSKFRLGINAKLAIAYVAIFVVFLFLVGLFTRAIFKSQIIKNLENNAASLLDDEARDLESFFDNLREHGLKSERNVKYWLEEDIKRVNLDKFEDRFSLIDGAFRTDTTGKKSEYISAGFVSERADLTNDIKRELLATENKFDYYSKGIENNVFNTYFISKKQYIRIYPKDWALEIESDHDFTKDRFYYIADPKHNPERKPVWTVPYYDSIWEHWMISLITPIYIEGEFVGIVGHDVILDDIYSRILNQSYFKTGISFIFDGNGNIILHPRFLNELKRKTEMGKPLFFKSAEDQELSAIINSVLDSSQTRKYILKMQISENGRDNYVFVHKMDAMNWYYAIDVPKSEILAQVPAFTSRFIIISVLSIFFLFIAVILMNKTLIIDRIKDLTLTSRKIKQGDLSQRANIDSEDEIGEFAAVFDETAEKLQGSLNNLRLDIEKRKKVELELRKHTSIIENSRDFIGTSRPDGKITYLNKAALKLLGWKGWENRDITETYPDWALEKIMNEGIKTSGRQGQWIGETALLSADGREIPTSQIIVSHTDEEGEILYYSTILRDLTERVKFEEELKEKEKTLRTILSASPIGIGLIKDRTFDWANDYFLDLLGYSEEELLGAETRIIYPSDYEYKEVEELYDILIKKGIATSETKLKRKDGKILNVYGNLALINKSDLSKGIIFAVQDITDLKKVEERLSLVIEATNDAIWDLDVKTGKAYFSPRYYTMLGFEPNEFESSYENWKELLHPEDADKAEAVIKGHLEEKKEEFAVEFRMKKKNGDWIWILGRGKTVERDESDAAVRMVGTHSDITERKTAEQALAESERKFKALFDNMKESAVLLDLVKNKSDEIIDVRVIEANKSFVDKISDVNDLNGELIEGRLISEIFNLDEFKKYMERIKAAAKQNTTLTFESEYPFDSPKYYFNVSIYLPQENRVAVIMQDITEKKKALLKIESINQELEERVVERTSELTDAMDGLKNEVEKRKKIQADLIRYQKELARALEREKELNRLKSEFVSLVSHQYRTPLTVIQTSSELLDRYFLKGDATSHKKHLERIDASISRMNEMIEKVMLIGRLESQEKKMKITRFNVVELIHKEVEEAKFYDKGRHGIVFDCQDENIVVHSDRMFVEQILNNLLSNALKYSLDGVEIRVECVQSKSVFTLSVEDEGVGIPEEDIKYIFEHFARGRNVATKEGTGLGLSIVKRLVEYLDGEITVDSELNKGTKFTIILPKFHPGLTSTGVR